MIATSEFFCWEKPTAIHSLIIISRISWPGRGARDQFDLSEDHGRDGHQTLSQLWFHAYRSFYCPAIAGQNKTPWFRSGYHGALNLATKNWPKQVRWCGRVGATKTRFLGPFWSWHHFTGLRGTYGTSTNWTWFNRRSDPFNHLQQSSTIFNHQSGGFWHWSGHNRHLLLIKPAMWAPPSYVCWFSFITWIL